MFQRLRQRIRDMKTIALLCKGAERHALRSGDTQPAAEHYLLSALDLPEGSARRVFRRLAADPDALPAAIAEQHRAALRGIGVAAPAGLLADEPAQALEPTRGLYRAQASGQAVMQALAARRTEHAALGMTGAHVVEVIAERRHGTLARALAVMGVDPSALRAAARAEIAASVGKH